jgi:hypothetical protein
MRRLALSLLLLAAAPAAQAEPADEARSAVGACLSAVIDHAPVGDVDGEGVSIRREPGQPVCTVQVSAGQPVVIRDAVITAIQRRAERFAPARTRWDPAGFASRDTFCSLPSRRNFNVMVSTAKPGEALVLLATVLEADKRDPRCDRDEGLQKPPLPQ